MSGNSFKRTSLLALVLMLISIAPLSARAQEGIKVHGDWTLTVRNPDGSVAGQYEFKNALSIQLAADRLLARLLARELPAGTWAIVLDGTPSCAGNGRSCVIGESSLANSDLVTNSNNLTIEVPSTGPNVGKLVLAGSMRAPIASDLVAVSTRLFICLGGSPCSKPFDNPFTNKNFVTAIPVVPSQTIDVVVVISFS